MVKVGDEIYVDTHLYLGHGADDFIGGKAKVTEVFKQMSGGKMTTFIRIAEKPETAWNWGQFLSKKQGRLQKQFGGNWAHRDPDMRPEFNEV